MTADSANTASSPLITSPLTTRGILSIAGPDSRRFLQGQSTADVLNLLSGQWMLAGFCTPKGRLFANGYLAALADDHFWLILPVDMVAGTLERLQKYAAFFKTELSDASKHWHGLASLQSTPLATAVPAGELTVNAHQVVMGMPGGNQIIWLDPLDETAYETTMARVEQADCVPEAHWDAAEIRQGLAWIVPATCEDFVPQALVWDELGGVSYHKGCYTGQEVVARLHYKGASKKQLRHVHGTGPAPAPGVSLRSSTDKAKGSLVRASALDAGWVGLAVVSVDNADTTLNLPDQQTAILDSWVVPTNKET